MKKTITGKKFERFFTAGIRALKAEGEEEDKNRFELSFSSEEPYNRYYGPEILCHDEEAVNLKRLNEIGVVLFNHERDAVIGRIEKAWVEGNRCKAIVVFDSDEKSQIIADKVRSGTLKAVSVGYIINRYEEVQAGKKSSNGRFTGPCIVVTDWEAYEISIVSVPADPTVGVGRELSPNEDSGEDKPKSNSRSVAEWDAIIENHLRRV